MEKVIEWRHDIHEFPELGNREFRTSKKVAEHLLSLGIEVETGIAYTGVVGLIRGGEPGPTIALRADMDALPVTEQTGLPFASKQRTTYLGQDVGVMHACGHDAHVAILMGAAEFLAKNKKNLKGNIMLIFQPAEEGAPEGEGGGAELMLAEGIFDRYNPEVIFGLHVTNSRHGHLGVLPGPAMAAASSYRITVNGVQAHGSRPWDSVDPIMATAQLIESLNTVVSRRINIINNPAVISVGMVQAGTRNNIIPDKSQITGTIRTFDPDLRAEIYDEIRQIARGVAEGTGTKVDVEFDVGGFYPVTFNNIELTNKYSKNTIIRSPMGVVGCISPWNLPLYLFSWKIAPALITGNTVIAKPSEITPFTAFKFSELCQKIGLPPGVLNIVHGNGVQTGEAIVAHRRIKAISFTGGTVDRSV